MRGKKRGTIALVFTIFLLLLASLTLAVNDNSLGCYLFPNPDNDNYCSDVSFAQAQELCAEDNCLDPIDYFEENIACNELAECELIRCNVDCSYNTPFGLCEALGEFESQGIAVPLPGEPVANGALQCGVGCCIIQDPAGQNNICEPSFTTRYECELTSLQIYGSTDPVSWQPGVNRVSCLQTCELEDFDDVIGQNQQPPPQGAALIAGIVTTNNNPLADVQIFYRGPVQGASEPTNRNGEYEITALPAGTYTLTASKAGYTQASQEVTLAEGQVKDDAHFELEAAAIQGVSGSTSVEIELGNPQPQWLVDIFINGEFRTKSNYPNGDFQVNLNVEEENQQFILLARWSNYEARIPFELSPGESIQVDPILTQVLGECSEDGPTPQKNVEEFIPNHVPGEKAVLLRWVKPCAEVIGYTITRSHNEEETLLPRQPSTARFFEDSNELEWDETYTYSIVANYPGRDSLAPTTVSIELGNVACENKYNEESGWARFCRLEDHLTIEEERQTVYSCTNENQLISENCANYGGGFYCSRAGANSAACKSVAECSLAGTHFGLYYSQESCYGTANPLEGVENFCYYDYTNSIVDQCNSCLEIEDCFAYQSKSACEINNCLGTACSWVDGAANEEVISYENINLPELVTAETGAGYCVQDNYENNDKCSLCGPESTIFENFFCTAEVCSSLGECFSNSQLSECNSCPDEPTLEANCHTYQTELECTGYQDTQRSDNAQLLLSQDQCNWNRCSWLGNAEGGTCVKDGDGNAQADCDELPFGLQQQCRLDNTPPQTTLNTQVISLERPTLNFKATDDSGAGALEYCLTSPENDECTSFEDNFHKIHYFGDSQIETLEVNFVEEQEAQINGESYKLKYFSTDKFHNQENLKETFIFIDSVAPDFTIQADIQTQDLLTTLTTFLDQHTNDPMQCTFSLRSILPLFDDHERVVNKQTLQKEATFADLTGLRYNLDVTCTDEHGNSNTQTKGFVFDIDNNIEITSPQGIITTKEVSLDVTTLTSASCQLYFVDTTQQIPQNTLVGNLATNQEAINHNINLDISEHYPDTFHVVNNYLVQCTDHLTSEEYQEFTNFVVDTTPGSAQIILTENDQPQRPLGDEWQEFFIESAQLSFECLDQEEGFACESFHYCLAESADQSCRGDDPLSYQTYNEPVSIDESTYICYFAKDAANNQPYDIRCGTISIDGFGITLLHPLPYTYQNELWGVSMHSEFDWRFFTRVNTAQCKFDFIPGFNYDDVAPLRVINPLEPNTYTFGNFPLAAGLEPYQEQGGVFPVYVRCENDQNIISPEKKINLEYDPTDPVIENVIAIPNPLIEGARVTLHVETDDKTICKFDEESRSYDTMQYYFPDSSPDKNILRTTHQSYYPINFVGLRKNYSINTACSNAAGLLSNVAQINFTVDYTLEGNIILVYPSGDYLNTNEVNSLVETSRNAVCEYRSADEYLPFENSNNQREHTALLSDFVEQHYIFPLRCTMAANRVVNSEITFTIDRTAPIIESVIDGNFTCGSDTASVLVHSNEENISTFSYELFDLGLQRGILPQDNNSNDSVPLFNQAQHELVDSGQVQITNPFEIPIGQLKVGHKYAISVHVTDAAGNVALQSVESDGFIVTAEDFEICEADDNPPQIAFNINDSSCTSVAAQMNCDDALGCSNFKYAKSDSSSCIANLPYNGQKILFDGSGYLCYSAQDYAGNNITGKRQITFEDNDGDGITNSCDQCSGTRPNIIVDELGCSDSQVPVNDRSIDSDNDQLPDRWEKLFDSFNCELNYLDPDSNANSILDNLEDYDNDGFSNFDEYVASTDPCIAGAPLIPDDDTDETLLDFTIPAAKDSNIFALLFLILGLLLIGGGVGYLIYYYKQNTVRLSGVGGAGPSTLSRSRVAPTKTQSSGFFKTELGRSRRARQQKQKQHSRSALFGEFSKESSKIPHVGKYIQTKSNHLPRLDKLSQKYHQHRDQIKPGLRREEKGLFKRLDQIAAQTKKKDITQVVTKSEAKGIFSKLRKLVKERKK